MTNLVPFDTSKSPWLESGEWVRVKDATDPNYDREGEVTDRTIYGGTVHFEDYDVAYRNDQLERLGQRRAVVWRVIELPRESNMQSLRVDLYRNHTKIGSNVEYQIVMAALDRLMHHGDTFEGVL